MKRLLLASILAVPIALPAAAQPSTPDYSSPRAKRGTTIDFIVVTRDGKPTKVKRFQFQDLLLDCNEGALNFGTAPPGFGPMKVRDKEFGDRFPFTTQSGGSGTVRIAGEFRKRNAVVRGVLRAKGDFPGSGRTDCDSGRVEWKAG